MKKNDDHALEYVDAYLHGVLSEEAAERVAAHCESCPVCRAALAEAQTRLEALETLPPVEASEDLLQRSLERVERYRVVRSRWIRGAWIAAAAVVVALAGAHAYYYNLSASPYDLRVLGQSDLLAGADASLRVVVVDSRDGAPQSEVPVEIDLIRSKPRSVFHLASFTTDEYGSGTVRMRVPDWEPGGYRLRVRASTGFLKTESIERDVSIRRSWQLMLTSDKPVYQPGQVIHLRSLALSRPGMKPVAGQEAVFSVIDPKGNVIFRNRDATSRFGICSTDCPLAGEVLEGAYQLRCEVGDTASTITVEVKKYVLPKFKVAVELDQPYYMAGQKIRGTASTRYFFGKPLPNTEVEIEIETNAALSGRMDNVKVKTDSQGKAAFEFTLPNWIGGWQRDSGDGRFWLTATVRDSAGQEQSATVSRLIAQQAIRIEVVAEAGTLVPGLPNNVYLLTSYPDGRPAETRLAITGIYREISTNSMGAASVEITPDTRDVRLTIRATDAAGQTGRSEVTLSPGLSGADFLVRTDKAVYDGGQTIHVLALGGGIEPIFFDVIKDGQTMITDVIAMANGRAEYEIDLPPELFGTLQLCAYRYGREGLPILQTRVIYVKRAGGLKVDVRTDRPEHRPGEQAKLTFAVTDRQGKPVPGALSLAAVDEAVFSVLGPMPGITAVFSSLEQELLKPIYAIYPWSPDFAIQAPAEERDQFQKALFARAEQRGIGRDYSLQDSSYLTNVQQFEHFRDRRLGQIGLTWVLLGIGGGFTLVLLFFRWLFASLGAAVVLLGTVIFIFVVGLVMPTLFGGRESARGIVKSADMAPAAATAERRPQPSGIPPSMPPARVREWFPETLLWRPELITDDNGRASLDLNLADSITTWRLSTAAISAQGQLGGAEASIRVFQPFFVDVNLPVALTRGDEVSVPAVVYNYLDKPLSVELRLDDASWFERLDPPVQKVELTAGEVRSIGYRLSVRQAGRHELTVHAKGNGVADAIKRSIEVVPDGRRVEQTVSGTLQQPAEMTWETPTDAIEGSVTAHLKLYPSTFSQLIDGLEAVFQQPYGCFEQTSSTTYPNVLALDYLRRTKKSVPTVEATAKQYIHLGYQRLLSFEVPNGGFDWFGYPPAKLTLTAYGLMEFTDMARVHDVDPRLIDRTTRWLLAQQKPDGSWSPEDRLLHDDPTAAGKDLRRLSTTAYIAWSAFDGTAVDAGRAMAAADFLKRHEPATIDDPYVLALVANALLAIHSGEPQHARPYLERLETMSRRSADNKLVWWEQGGDRRTTFYGSGRSGSIETTALAALAMIEGRFNPATTRGALAWLISQKDAAGMWHSTQATVLALKALLAGTNRPLAEAQTRQIEIEVDGKTFQTISIPADQAEVVQQIDLSAAVASGKHRVAIREPSATGTGFLATLAYHVPGKDRRAASEPLSIELDYDKTTLAVDDQVRVMATVTNRMADPAPMVILDLPIPAGFAVETADFDASRQGGQIAKYQLTPRSVIVYLRALNPGQPLKLSYRLRATMPVKITAPGARAYEYYNPDRQAATDSTALTVAAAK